MTHDQVLEALEGVTRTMLGLEVTDPDADPPSERARDRLTAVVELSGAWRGAVLLSCSRRLAGVACERMLAPVGGGEAKLQDTFDALGELTNMLAGQVKALLPGPTRIGIPEVSGLGGTGLLLRGARPALTLSCALASEVLLVQVYERD